MAKIIATDFDMSEVPIIYHSKYHHIFDQFLKNGKLKLEVENPNNAPLSRGEKNEAVRIYNATHQHIRRHLPQKVLRGAIRGNTLWLWLEDREEKCAK